MTEVELWQVVLLARENTFNAINAVMFGMSGYLMIAYFVGARLSRFQVLLVSALFVFYECGNLFIAANQMKIARHYGRALIRDFGVDFIWTGQAIVKWAGPLLIGLLTVASLYFMYQIRQRPELGAGSGKTGSS